ncbi:hypothetical protein [Rickettsia australis]|uniref:Uncharacterized protein n=1 Tax=Rickettsia australis (strain Cutlack) TaxID=1105110 RepID=H8K726_RICAC|nr:hypothetical protein [Rickettsia australis]AFC71069.1 hypothetical protein MC5_03725 [Rickettsia australis str. Cutlack]
MLEKERQAKIDTKPLEEFLATTPKIDQLSEGQLREHFNVPMGDTKSLAFRRREDIMKLLWRRIYKEI